MTSRRDSRRSGPLGAALGLASLAAGCGAGAGTQDPHAQAGELQSAVTTVFPIQAQLADWGYPDRRWMVDFDGDGKADFCRAVGNGSGAGSYLACALSTGTGFQSEYTVFAPLSNWGHADRRWMVDFNGDGRADFCRAIDNPSGAGGALACALSTGTGLQSELTMIAPLADWGHADRRWMADFDGDRKADYCRAVGNLSGPSALACALSTGTGLQSEYTVFAPLADWGYADRRWMVDFDGDGRADYCRAVGNPSGPGTLACALSTGTGLQSEYTVFAPLADWGHADRRWMADFDGDERADYCRAVGNPSGPGTLACALSTGAGFASEYTEMIPIADWGTSSRWFVDFDGNSQLDYSRVTSGNVMVIDRMWQCPAGQTLVGTECVTLIPWNGNPLANGARIAMRVSKRYKADNCDGCTGVESFDPAWVKLTTTQRTFLDASGATLTSDGIFTVTTIPRAPNEILAGNSPSSYQKILLRTFNGVYLGMDAAGWLIASQTQEHTYILVLDLTRGTTAGLYDTRVPYRLNAILESYQANPCGTHFKSFNGNTYYDSMCQGGFSQASFFELFIVE